MTSRRNDFSKGKTSHLIMQLAIPMSIAQLINVLYNVVDRIYIGRIANVGTLALSGIGITFPIITMISAFANLVGMGGAPLCSIERGRNDLEKARRILGTSFLLLLIFGFLLTLSILLTKNSLLYLFGASDATFVYANDYLSIYLLGTVFSLVSLGLNNFINAQGFAKQGMFTILIGAFINLILDPIFIFLFNMGVKGAALVSVLAQLVSMLWTLYFLKGTEAIIQLKQQFIAFDFPIIKDIITLGFSGFIMAVTNSIVQIVCNATLSVYGGDIYISIMTIINSIREMVFMPVNGITSSAQPVMGYNYGAKLYSRVKSCIHFISLATFLYTLGIWLILFLFPEPFLRIFTNDVATISHGVIALHTYFFGFFFMAFQFAGQSTFVALNKPKQAVFFSIFRKVIIVTPLTILLPRVPQIGILGVFLAEPISNLIGGLSSYLTMYFTVYRKLPQHDGVIE